MGVPPTNSVGGDQKLNRCAGFGAAEEKSKSRRMIKSRKRIRSKMTSKMMTTSAGTSNPTPALNLALHPLPTLHLSPNLAIPWLAAVTHTQFWMP
jgi:hypothetical protein